MFITCKMDSAEIFQKRAGTTDKGREYENIAIANIALQMLSDDLINNFHITSNDNNFGAFDDVVIKIESHQNVVVKAMQLKHSDRKTLSSEHLKSAKGNFSLSKYFESFQQLKNVVQEFIIFTNRSFGAKEDAKFQLQGQKFYVRPVKVCSSSAHFAISKNVNFVYKFEIVEDAWTMEHISEIQEYRTFFSKFFLYTNQENFDALRQSTIEKFRTMYSLNEKDFDQYYKIISEWNMREGEKEKLNKKWMKRAIALEILSPHIESLCFGAVNDQMKILRDAISMFTITLVDENSCETAKHLWGDVGKQNIDIEEINRIRINYQLSVDDINANDVEKLNSKLFSQLLWLMDKCPLIIRDFKNFEKAVKLCEDLKFVVLGDGMKEEWMTHYSLFQNLSNLSLKGEFYQKIMETFTVSIQGKEEFNLMAAFRKTEKFLENVTTSDLMGMLNGPCFIDGEKEILSQPYIERHLSQNIIDINYLEKVHENTIIILQYADNFDKVKDKVKKYKLINVDNFPKKQCENDEGSTENTVSNKSAFNVSFDKTDFRNKMYISNSKLCESKLKQIYTDNSKMHRFHYFKVASNGHLQWIQSKGDMSDLENYKVSNSSFTHENFLWSSQLENNINLITSDPGMGKSELMKSFKNKCPSQNWTVTIYPKDVHLFFKSFNLSQGSNYLTWFERFIINEKYGSLKKLDQSFFKMCLKQNRIVYVWDGLDEILNEYLDVVSDIILQLSKRGFVQWVTSRKHLQTFLEKKFNVLSIGLTQFSDKEQQNYIKQRLKFVRSEGETEITIQKIKSTFVIIEHVDILGIPLQIFMLTELFRRNTEKYFELMGNKFRLTDLYSNFIEEKFNIFYENKSDYDVQNPHMAVMVRREKQKMLKHYEILALKLIYPEFLLQRLDINYQKSVKKFSRNDYASVGIISEVQNNVPHFLHGSFAEYLVATYLSKNFTNIPTDIFFDHKYNNVRFFFDMLLAEDSPVHLAVLCRNFDLLKTYDEEMLTRKDIGGRSALHLICSWGQRHPYVQIIQEGNKCIVDEGTRFNGKPEGKEFLEAVMYLQIKNNNSEHDSLLGITPLLYAKRSESLAVELKLLLETEKNSKLYQSYTYNDRINLLYYSALLGYDDIIELFTSLSNFTTKVDGSTALILACEGGHKQIIEYLVNSGNEVNRADNNGDTPLYVASQNDDEIIVEFLVQSGANINHANKQGSTALHNASLNGHEKIVEFLLKSGAEINCPNNARITPLLLASTNGHLQVVEYLVESGAELNPSINDCCTPLDAAAQNGHALIVEFLVKSGAELNQANHDDFTPLHRASENGHLQTAKYLVESGAEIHRSTNFGYTSLHIATQNGHELVVEFLVKSGAEINRADRDGFTPLDIASENGHEIIVEFLLKSGADVNRAAEHGVRSLRIASFNGHEKIVECLVKSGVEINRADNDGFTPLYLASQNGHLQIVKYLVKSGAEINRPMNRGYIPLHMASQNGHELVVEHLVESGADINHANKYGRTALHDASLNGQEKIVEFLLKSGAEINRPDHEGITPLFLASKNGHFQIVKYLVKSGAELNPSFSLCCAPLDVAARNGHDLIVEFLVKLGAEINRANHDDFTPLHGASENGHLQTVKCLVESGAEIDRPTYLGITALHIATQNGHELIVQYLVKSGANINRLHKDGFTPLGIASLNGHENIVECLVKSGAEINQTVKDGYTPLYLAAQNGHLQTVKYLVESGVEIDRPTNFGSTPLHIAIQNGHELIVEYLVKSGANINRSHKNGFTPLTIASINGVENVVVCLVKSGAEINQTIKDGFTSLYLAAQHGHLQTVKYLVDFGAEIDRPTNLASTPLQIATQNGHELIVEFLLKSGAEVNRANYDGFTALHVASQDGHLQTIKYLVESGAEIDRPANLGNTALHIAAHNGHALIVEYLVKSGANINRPDKNGLTPLGVASINGGENIVDYLVKSGAEINQTAKDGFTSLHLAAQNGHLQTVKYLVESGAEIDRPTKLASTPLHIATQNGHELIVEFLVKSGADVNRVAKDGYTALRAASFDGHETIVECLVKSGADINQKDNNGFTSLYAASQNGHLLTVKYLVESGAEINSPTNFGLTPLHIASQNGHETVVEFLVKSGAEINHADTDGLIPLHEACLKGHEKIVECLVKSGAEINSRNNDGFTPLYLASQNGHLQTVKCLVKLGAEVNRTNNTGRTPLYIAFRMGHEIIVEFLVKSGAKVHLANNDGSIPL
ncbi:uncharacterized protein LOC135139274 [Zophobas morio]|uniref:uncharacterized protein LOC135139274 n=1 Tax=Zophobas morio TaxID=2755281 RepID=UPI0030837F39